MQDHKLVFPFADADVQTLGDTATMTQTITNTYTILQRLTGFGQAVTGLSLQAAPDLKIGSRVKIDILQNATGRNVTFGSAGSTIVGQVLTGVASDRDTVTLTWNGTAFIADSVWQKTFDAA